MAKNVCIVGAGPSGLVAAKTLLYNAPAGAFKVTIFDAQRRIGGLWPAENNDRDGLIHPLMVANQSKHTVQFSDLAWEPGTPEFPQAWQVGHYLSRYLDRYGGANVKLGHRVVRTKLAGDGTWQVTVQSDSGEETVGFDCLLIATGFFGKPIIPSSMSDVSGVPVIHSSRYRDLNGLLDQGNGEGGKILVVGGQMSGIEISGTIGTQLSSAVNSPAPSPIPNPERYTIHHIIQRPAWVFPLFTSPMAGQSAAPFLPLDCSSYNLSNRVQPLDNSQGHITEDEAHHTHKRYSAALGTDQSEFSELVSIKNDTVKEPPYLAVSEYYMEFVRSGLIGITHGKLDSMNGNTALIGPSNKLIDNVVAVVLATGFDPSPGLAFLQEHVLQTLCHSPSHTSLPLALSFHGTQHPKLPTLGFVGFYRSPYWGVMEMQARFLSVLWTPPSFSPQPSSLVAGLSHDKSIERIASLRDDPRTTQFPMGDYAYLMQEFSIALGISISPPLEPPTPVLPHNNKSMDILTPARYMSKLTDETAVAEMRISLEQTHATALAGLTGSRFVAHGVFRSLLGKWSLERDLDSKLSSHPSGHFSGTAQFLLRDLTSDGLQCVTGSIPDSVPTDGGGGLEYLYIEEGEFRADNGLVFKATRRYIWRYDDVRDVISVWFVKPDDSKRADYLFHEIEFTVTDGGSSKGWAAKAGHLCIDDFYNVEYEFSFKAVNLEQWTTGYAVKGPKKDYTIRGVYRR